MEYQYPDPLIQGTLLKRYKRFLTDVELEGGEIVVAHCVNTGSMTGCKEPGSTVYLSPANNPKRKLRFTWEIVETKNTYIGINTALANRIVENAITNQKIEELRDYPEMRREVKYGENSRIDLLLSREDEPPCFVEVKNVTLGDEGIARFPDAVTERGRKHLHEMAREVEKGARAVMFYLVQRDDCHTFKPADEIDPQYGEALRKAMNMGVEAVAYTAKVRPAGIEVIQSIPVVV